MSDHEVKSLNRACPLCEHNTAETLWTKGALRVVQCHRCAMVFANPVPDELASGLFYCQRLYYFSQDKVESDYAPVRFEREVRLLRSYCRRGNVLDVGCSTGGFLHQLKTRWPQAYQVGGTDVAGATLDYAQGRGLSVLRESFLDLSSSEAVYDAITFWAVMEHFIYPKRFLAKAARMLRPGGYCFILVPNLASLAFRLLGPKYRYVVPEHVNYFSPATLQEFARSEPGFEIVKIRSTHFNPIVLWQDFKANSERVPDEQRARLLKRTTGWKQNPWLKPVKVLYGGLEGVLGLMKLADNLVMVLRRKELATRPDKEPG